MGINRNFWFGELVKDFCMEKKLGRNFLSVYSFPSVLHSLFSLASLIMLTNALQLTVNNELESDPTMAEERRKAKGKNWDALIIVGFLSFSVCCLLMYFIAFCWELPFGIWEEIARVDKA